MGVAGEAAEEGAAEGSEMEKQWDLVFKALGLGCKSKALAQSSDLTCQSAGSPCLPLCRQEQKLSHWLSGPTAVGRKQLQHSPLPLNIK